MRVFYHPIVKFAVEEFNLVENVYDWFNDMTQEQFDVIADYFGSEALYKLNNLLHSFTEFMATNLEEDNTNE